VLLRLSIRAFVMAVQDLCEGKLNKGGIHEEAYVLQSLAQIVARESSPVNAARARECHGVVLIIWRFLVSHYRLP
jgi:hypothetical protein